MSNLFSVILWYILNCRLKIRNNRFNIHINRFGFVIKIILSQLILNLFYIRIIDLEFFYQKKMKIYLQDLNLFFLLIWILNQLLRILNLQFKIYRKIGGRRLDYILFRLIKKYRFKPNGLQHYIKILGILNQDSNIIFLITGKSNKIPVLDKSDCIVKMEEYIQEMGCRALKKDPKTSIINKTQELIKDSIWPDYKDICCPLCCLFNSKPFVALEVLLA